MVCRALVVVARVVCGAWGVSCGEGGAGGGGGARRARESVEGEGKRKKLGGQPSGSNFYIRPFEGHRLFAALPG